MSHDDCTPEGVECEEFQGPLGSDLYSNHPGRMFVKRRTIIRPPNAGERAQDLSAGMTFPRMRLITRGEIADYLNGLRAEMDANVWRRLSAGILHWYEKKLAKVMRGETGLIVHPDGTVSPRGLPPSITSSAGRDHSQ